MQLMPIGSKQIAYIGYDERSSQMHILYHTGQVRTYSGIPPEQFQSLLASSNAYDMLVRLADAQTAEAAEAAEASEAMPTVAAAAHPAASRT
ncbi:KTSC domain-containing protein [Paenibacillus ginsengihumi]|uniref:KTSC domain-containing protein n=1 Tax=Paenibacillus ginsengihumi TaxID=431596 RepID=UPI000376219A|nr:KTSC domain-containing protein [Paenibacillus ginsengihumi]